MSQSKKHQYLLKHPVIAAFLFMKWQRMGPAYNKNLFFYLVSGLFLKVICINIVKSVAVIKNSSISLLVSLRYTNNRINPLSFTIAQGAKASIVSVAACAYCW
jgi:hypothetical protein